MAESTFEDYLKEREMLDKKMNMERLMEEFKDDMNRKKVMEQKQMAGYLDPMSEKNDIAMELFGKQLKDLTESELELLDEEIDRLRSKFMADGGRVSKQTGGITESRQLPPEFLEAAQKTF